MICSNQITKIFCTRYDSDNASSARGPCDFGPQTDLAISVFRCVSIKHCLPKSALLAGVGSKDGTWEELPCESLRSGTLSSTRFSLNSCSRSGMSEFNRSLRSKSRSSFLFGFGFWGWLGQQVSQFFPFNMFTWHSYGIGIYTTQVLPCLSSHTVSWHSWRCHGWWSRRGWGRRRMINFLPWMCHGCWRKQAWGRTLW